ncbi:type II toxin-antitoxin system HicB family antitoxin [archaeon]|jgi:predicted RNase H-like HicB family nuclease|nr:type II toxin-antitoxin system HicB family antitoxin [archaeon]NCT57944.1 type II toxin-antitoxin system HicB family antitoxin [archaeon]
MKFSAIITKEDKIFVALCPELNVVSQGDDENNALENLKEAVSLFLEDEDVKEVIKNIFPAKLYSIEIPA